MAKAICLYFFCAERARTEIVLLAAVRFLKEKPAKFGSLLWQRRWHGDSRDGGLIVAEIHIIAIFQAR
jgi:hypothetical protein